VFEVASSIERLKALRIVQYSRQSRTALSSRDFKPDTFNSVHLYHVLHAMIRENYPAGIKDIFFSMANDCLRYEPRTTFGVPA